MAFAADLLADATIGNPTLNSATVVVVFAVVVLKRYRQYRRDVEFARRVAARREHLIFKKTRHCEARGFDKDTTLRALAECDFDRAAVMELVLAGALPEQ